MRADGTTSRYPERWRPGDPVVAAELNRRLDVVQRTMQGIAPPRQRKPSPLRSRAAGNAALSGEGVFRVITVFDDYVFAEPIVDGVGTGELVGVALPWSLRTVAWDGLTILGVRYTRTGMHRRSAVAQGVTEDQRITPSYYVGEYIKADRVVAPPAPLIPVGGDSVPAEWETFGSHDWGAIVELP